MHSFHGGKSDMSSDNLDNLQGKVVLVTGAAHRVGASIVRTLHRHGMKTVIHYRMSRTSADELCAELNQRRPNSATTVSGDLSNTNALAGIIKQAVEKWGQLDVLVNNASSFYPTPVGSVNENQWEDLFSSNLKAPFFLSQAAAPWLSKVQGCIVNIVDIHAERPLKNFPVYSIAKAGLVMLTKALAREFGANIRVNAVAPGAILWPEGMEEEMKTEVIERTALKRVGHPDDIARAVLYLVRDATYTTGQVLAVDGGRSLSN